jgi:RHS repeat-associated protein
VVGEKAACPFRWPGQYEDDETGLYYNRFRYYDPQAGEYVSQDPIGLFGDNPTVYGYVGDPLSWIDTLGLSGCPDDYIPKSHRGVFKDGASFFITRSGLNRVKAGGTGKIGRPDGLFVMTRKEANSLARADLTTIKKRLGIPKKYWNEPLFRVDVPKSEMNNLRLPTGEEAGANAHFKPGGYTSGGALEAVIDPVDASAVKITSFP